MRYFLILICLFFVDRTSFCQVALSTLRNSNFTVVKQDLKAKSISNDTLSLPFIDDFSTSSVDPDTLLWMDEGNTYINNHFPINHPTINVATFDGTKKNGFPYVFPKVAASSLTVKGETDYLLSKPINLENLDGTENIAFSFYWQKGAKHEVQAPSLEKGDSLKLYFLNSSDQWIQVWPADSLDRVAITNYKIGDPFAYKFINITDTSFLHSAFQFKFQSTGVLTGNWSIWSVDYIYLNTNRTTQTVQDFGFSKQLSSLLDNFYSVPYTQFSDNPQAYISDNITTTYNNITNEENFRDKTIYTISDTYNNNKTLIDSTRVPTSIGDVGKLAGNTSYEVISNINKQPIIDHVNNSSETNIVLDYTITLSGDQIELLKTNDIIKSKNYISNYFAYDDGTAEATMEVANGGYILVAYEFDLKVQDTLTSVFFQWSRSGYDLSGVAFNLMVWKAIKGIDGASKDELLIRVPTVIAYDNEGISQYSRVNLSSQLILQPGKFYVGWESNSTDKLIKLGIDLSKDNSKKLFQYQENSWTNPNEKLFTGTPMIRPMFGYNSPEGMNAVGLEERYYPERRGITDLQVYPNPANNKVTIEGNYLSLKIYSLTGEIIWEKEFGSEETKYDLQTSSFPEGMYIVEARGKDKTYSKRLTITH